MPENNPRIFISHAWEDKALVREIESSLRDAGADVWVDHSELRGGQNLPKRISDALKWCNTLLLVWSKDAENSHWVVELGWTNAVSLRKAIVPGLIEKIDLPAILANTLFLDFRDRQNGIADLLHALKLSGSKIPVEGAEKAAHVARAIHNQLVVESAPVKTKPPQVEPWLRLRATPLERLSKSDVKVMLRKHGFYAKKYNWNKALSYPSGKGIRHDYQVQKNGRVIYDAGTGLYWQQAGSPTKSMMYADAEEYVKQLIRNNFAGYDNWRLPMLEEAMSLMERTRTDCTSMRNSTRRSGGS